MATTAQNEKFSKFQSHHLRESSLQLLRQAIEVAELPHSDIGHTWGVTVCVDPKTVIRLNVGNVSQFSVFKGGRPKVDPTGTVYFLYLAVVEKDLGVLGEPKGLRMLNGFETHVKDSVQLSGPFDDWCTKLFDNKRVCRAFTTHAQQALRGMPNPQWHNPLVNDLIR